MTRLSARLAPPLVALTLIGCPKQAPAPAASEGPTEIEVRKSPNDTREYRTFVLDNGMRVLLIHDEDTDMAAAAVDVHVGQFHDPEDRQGLSHFLEHMLFMGTEKYPDVDGYRKFITDHGGRSNAGTSQEHTTFHFSIEHSQLEPALDRFAEFFKAPKLDPEYVERERHAVNSEYSLKIKDEGRRNREVLRATSNPEHPFHKFSVGNLDTLEDTEDNPLWDDVKAHYEAEYSASRMAVGVIGREDLATLEQWVRDRFSEVPTNGKGATPATVPILRDEDRGVIVRIVPLVDRRTLQLQFPAPPRTEHFREHPVGAITSVLGHEGEGSLFAMLKSKGWIESLNAGGGGAEDHTMIQVSIGLTPDGYDHVDDIVDHVFQTVRLIERDGVEPWRFDEAAKIAELNFRFADESSPVSAARSARNLQTWPAEHVLDWWATYGEYDADLVHSYLATMRPENMRMVLIAPDQETDQVEPLYDVPYAVEKIDAETMESWWTSPIDEALALPEPNPFVAEDVTLLDAALDTGSPTTLDGPDGVTVWHHADVSFGVPEAYVRANLLAPAPAKDVESRVKNVVLGALVDDSLEEFAYLPKLAGLRFDASSSSRGFRLEVGGYDDKQMEVLERLTERVSEFEVDPERFAIEQARIVREWRNTVTARPMSQASWELGEILDPLDYDYLDGADLIEDLTVDDVQSWADGFLEGATIELLVHGNASSEDAIAIADHLAEVFVDDEPAERPTVEIRKIPETGELVRDVEIDHDDSTFIAQYQGRETSHDEHAKYRMLGQVLKTPFFTELRTEQQLGYLVHAYYTRNDVVPGLRFAIQSSSAGPVELEERVDEFVAAFHETLKAMPDEEYETIRAGLVADLEEKELRIGQRFSRYVGELSRGYTDFQSKEAIVEAVKQVDKQTLVDFYAERLLAEDAGRVIVRSFGKLHGEDDPHEPGCATTTCVTDQMRERFSRPY